MAFTATITNINFQEDSFWAVYVDFADSGSGWKSSKTYIFPSSETQTQAVAAIVADGTALKNNLATMAALQSKVGTVITI